MLSLPSLGELDQGLRVRVFLCTSPTDMRKGFDTLAVLVREGSGYDPLSGHLIYRAGVALLDADRPHKLLARSPRLDLPSRGTVRSVETRAQRRVSTSC